LIGRYFEPCGMTPWSLVHNIDTWRGDFVHRISVINVNLCTR
jgi:hypothetical protein